MYRECTSCLEGSYCFETIRLYYRYCPDCFRRLPDTTLETKTIRDRDYEDIVVYELDMARQRGPKGFVFDDAGAIRSGTSYRRWEELGLGVSTNPTSFPIGNRSAEWSIHIGSSSPGLVVRQRGLEVLVKGRKNSAFGDTGAGQNVISDRKRTELGLEMISNPTYFPMGNKKRIFSPGIVKFPIAFEDDPTNIITIVAHVVHTFAYDLLLGNKFLEATNCLTKYIHRFVPCLFSLKSRWSMNLLGETTNRFHGQLGKGIEVFALPDIGSVKNVMNADWALERAKAGGFEILSRPENRGWIVFPNGTEEATVGQARTTVTLPDGKVVPMVFELLPNCYVPVVLGQDFVFDEDIYTRYPGSVREVSNYDSGDELMPMGFRESRSEKKGTGKGAAPRETDDLERQLKWNINYQHGRKASPEEWDQENSRREEYERRRNPSWQPGPPLIDYKPQGSGHLPALPGSNNTHSGFSDATTSVGRSLSAQTTVSSSTVSSASDETFLGNTSHSSLDSPPGEHSARGMWDDLYFGDFGRDEASQWREG